MSHASLMMDFFRQFLRRGRHNGDAPVSEFVDELRPAGAGDLGPFDWEISPCEYHSKAAATRISFTNSVGDKRRAEAFLLARRVVGAPLNSSPF